MVVTLVLGQQKRYLRLTMIEKVKTFLQLQDWDIQTQSILKNQVVYDLTVPLKDRYFIGVLRDFKNKSAILYHDRDLRQRDVLHELLHIKYPSFSERKINILELILNYLLFFKK